MENFTTNQRLHWVPKDKIIFIYFQTVTHYWEPSLVNNLEIAQWRKKLRKKLREANVKVEQSKKMQLNVLHKQVLCVNARLKLQI